MGGYKNSAAGSRLRLEFGSEKGGISGIINEIIITAVLLSLLLVVIGLFRKNMDIIRSSAEKSFETEKAYADIAPVLPPSQVTGLDVIAVIRYYSNDDGVAVTVRDGTRVETYRGQTYDAESFPIEYAAKFEYSCEYDGSKLINVDFRRIN